MKKRQPELLIFILFIILACLAGCSGAEDKVVAVEAVITELRNNAPIQDLSTQEEKSVIQLLLEKATADDILSQINEQFKLKSGDVSEYNIDVDIPTLANITLDSLDYSMPIANYTAPDPEIYTQNVTSAVTDSIYNYISGNEMLSYKTFKIKCIIKNTKNGYNAAFDDADMTQVISEINASIQTLIRSAAESSEIDKVTFAYEMRKQIDDEISEILLNTYDSWEYPFYDRLSIQELIPKDDDQFSLVFSYPDMDKVFKQAAAELTASYENRYPEGIYTLLDSYSLEIDYNTILVDMVQNTPGMTTRTFIDTYEKISDATFFLSTLLKNELYLAYEQAIVAAADEINTALLKQPILSPGTGVMFGSDNGESSVTFFTGEGDGAHYVKFERLTGTDLSEDGQTELTAYIDDGQTLTVYLPIGNYKLKYGTGTSWYGEEQMFGPDGDDVVADIVVNIEYGYDYSLTLYSVYDGNMGSDPISQNDF